MNRKAILICSPGSPYLKGVALDIENMKNFLLSANGGSWKESEIFISRFDPDYEEIEKHLISLEEMDFSVVYYSGHGYTDQDGVGRINLNLNQNPSIRRFEHRSKRQITIIDACRGYSEYAGIDGLAAPAVSKIKFDNNNPEHARKIFDAYTLKCSEGRVLLHAAQKGQNAEDTNSGGYFSSNLLLSALYMARNSNEPILNIYNIFEKAYDLTQNRHQPNLIYTNKDALVLPFAIKSEIDSKSKVRLQGFADKKIEKNKNGTVVLKVVALLGIAYIAKQLFFKKSTKK
jgi:hypothetical protein